MDACSEDFQFGDDFEAVLAILYSHHHDANVTEAYVEVHFTNK